MLLTQEVTTSSFLTHDRAQAVDLLAVRAPQAAVRGDERTATLAAKQLLKLAIQEPPGLLMNLQTGRVSCVR